VPTRGKNIVTDIKGSLKTINNPKYACTRNEISVFQLNNSKQTRELV